MVGKLANRIAQWAVLGTMGIVCIVGIAYFICAIYAI